ncbi:MAG: hypothetical protein RIC19_19600, partial [Phaeodactylibacter sp.]|uniref:hypothetical protein n=1 Tax=Phaeodactylibacter sp. TaxID=1940289 RepID=UPI0032EB6AFA
MQKAIHPAFILALALLLASGCRKEDEECYDPTDSSCANYDPCWEKEAVSAAFAMEERVAHFDSVWLISSDSEPPNCIRSSSLSHVRGSP